MDFFRYPGSSQKRCLTCFGLGVYWDVPTIPFTAWMKFVDMSPTPDEPGVRVDQNYGVTQLAEPSLTLPFTNPWLAADDPALAVTAQAWAQASLYDRFMPVDMISRFTAGLQVGSREVLPYQQSLFVAPSGAVTVWNPSTSMIEPVSSYTVSGANRDRQRLRSRHGIHGRIPGFAGLCGVPASRRCAARAAFRSRHRE